MKTRAELKQEAKNALKGNWGWAISVTLLPLLIVITIFTVIFMMIGMSSTTLDMNGEATMTPMGIILLLVLYIFYFLVLLGLSVDFAKAFLDLVRGKKQSFTPVLKYAFTEKRFGKFFLTNLVMGIFLYLWNLLLMIPGIIKSFSYAQANYILVDQLDNGEKPTVTEPITKSRAMMDGHKWEYFVLQLSFLGWILLGTLTLGIGFIWLTPYISATNAAYYDNLKSENSGEPQILGRQEAVVEEKPEVITAVNTGDETSESIITPEVEEEKTEPQTVEETKEEIMSEVPIMGQPDVKDASMK